MIVVKDREHAWELFRQTWPNGVQPDQRTTWPGMESVGSPWRCDGGRGRCRIPFAFGYRTAHGLMIFLRAASKLEADVHKKAGVDVRPEKYLSFDPTASELDWVDLGGWHPALTRTVWCPDHLEQRLDLSAVRARFQRRAGHRL